MMKNEKSTKKLQIFHAGELTEASYELTVDEKKVLFALCARMNPLEKHFEIIRISSQDLSNACGFDDKNGDEQLQIIVKKLLSRSVVIPKPKDNVRCHVTNWIHSCEYAGNTESGLNSYFEFRLNPQLFLQLWQ